MAYPHTNTVATVPPEKGICPRVRRCNIIFYRFTVNAYYDSASKPNFPPGSGDDIMNFPDFLRYLPKRSD